MQLQNLSRVDILQLGQQQTTRVINNETFYIPPRRNMAFSTLSHTSSNVVYVSDEAVGVIQNPPQSASSEDPIPAGPGPSGLNWDVVPVIDEEEATGLTQTRATLNVQDDALSISHETVVQNIYADNTQIPIKDE